MNQSVLTDRSQESDEHLFERFRSGRDREATTELIHRYEGPLFRYLYRFCGNRQLAEDLFQTTFQRVLERSAQFTAGRAFRPWLYSIATHSAIDARRRSERVRSMEPQIEDDSRAATIADVLPDREPGPSDQLQSQEQRVLLRSAIDTLSDDSRAIVLLVYYQGLKLREVAEALHIPVGTVKSRLHKTLHNLHDACLKTFPELV